MKLELKYRGEKIEAELNEDGIFYRCPFCGRKCGLDASIIKATGTDVRTIGPVTCPWDECGVPFELAHSCFVKWAPTDGDIWMMRCSGRWNAALRRIWTSHNERRKRTSGRGRLRPRRRSR